MISLLVIIPLLIMAGAIAAAWSRMGRRITTESNIRVPFRWRYIISPVVILVICLIVSALFYSRLPEQIAYHFKTDGTPDAFIGRMALVAIGLAIQLILAIIGLAIVVGVSRSGIAATADNQTIKPETLLIFMGNVVALPQLVIAFTLFDIFSYNAYQVHLLPVWLFAIILLVLATLAFLAFSIKITLRGLRKSK